FETISSKRYSRTKVSRSMNTRPPAVVTARIARLATHRHIVRSVVRAKVAACPTVSHRRRSARLISGRLSLGIAGSFGVDFADDVAPHRLRPFLAVERH